MKVKKLVTIGLSTVFVVQLAWLAIFISSARRVADGEGPSDRLTALRRRLDDYAVPAYFVSGPQRSTEQHDTSWNTVLHPKETPQATTTATDEPKSSTAPLVALKLDHDARVPLERERGDEPAKASKKPIPDKLRVVQVEGDVLHSASSQINLTAVMDASQSPTSLRKLAKAAVVVVAYNRPDLLQGAIDAVSSARLSSKIAKYISQDGDDERTRYVAETSSTLGFSYLQHARTLKPFLGPDGTETPTTMFVAAHYKWILDVLFVEKGHSHVIILEDDLKVSSDFFEFFEMLAPLLDADPTLWCISSWNDNGFKHFETPPTALFRSSYFPGLGWMLKRDLWIDELSSHFPDDNWDHWMRATTTSKNRECVSPFLSRNYNVGVGGATSNQEFYQQFLEPISFDASPAPMGLGDLSYLLNERYFAQFKRFVSEGPRGGGIRTLTPSEIKSPLDGRQFPPRAATVVPFVKEDFEALAIQLQIHPSPRSSYRRTIWLKFNDGDIFLVDRRLSPFVSDALRLRVHASLAVVPAAEAGMSCDAVCRAMPASSRGYMWRCRSDQFEFINDCQVLGEYLGCPNGCTQGWGEDIPNVEVSATGHTPRCLATEMMPTCAASFALTRRLCPCVPRKKKEGGGDAALMERPVPRSPGDEHIPAALVPRAGGDSDVVIVAAASSGKSCSEVCADHTPSETTAAGGRPQGEGANYHSRVDQLPTRLECYADAFAVVNDCALLRRHFPCSSCDVNWGPDIPNFVSDSTDGNYKHCLITKDLAATTCDGRHAHTQRLCPCQRQR